MPKILYYINRGISIALLSVMLPLSEAAASVPTEASLLFSNNQQYVEIPYQSALDLSVNTFTVSAWIYPLTWGQNNQGRILDHGGGSSGSSGWALHVNDSGSAAQAISFQINNDSSFSSSSNNNVVQLNTWQHVAVSYDNGTLTFYVDGVEQGINTTVPVPNARISPLRIGVRATDLFRGFDGKIDEVRVWDRTLLPAEIQANMNVELSGTETGLISYYRINSAIGQIAFDSSIAGNDATLGSTGGADINDPTWSVEVNQPPIVDAGPDQIIVLPTTSVNLSANVSDDGLPVGLLITDWSVVSGPGTVTFSNATVVNSSATFSVDGVYQLRLQADDSELVTFDDVTVTVDPVAVLTSITVQPNAITLDLGEMQTFTAVGMDQGNNPYSIAPVWSATGGSIDQQGNYIAATLTGSYTILATDGVVSGNSSVTVQDPSAYLWPTNGWLVATPDAVGLQESLLDQARDYALTGGGSGMLVKGGELAYSWGSLSSRYTQKSTTKSFGSAIAGLAVKDGLINLDTLVQTYLPSIGLPPSSNASTGWPELITIKHLLTHSAGFDVNGGYEDILFQPGTVWAYSDGGANWLADALTVTYATDLKTILFDRILTPMGLGSADLTWRNNAYRSDTIGGVKSREFGSGISASVDAMARFGYLFLRQGEWDGQQLIPASYIAELSTAAPSITGLPVNFPQDYFNASDHYGYLWWNNADGTMAHVPTDAYWSWGLLESLIIVIPSLDIVITRAGSGWRSGWDGDYSIIEPFLEPIVLSTLGESYDVTVDAAATVLNVLSNDMATVFAGETLTIISVGPTSAGGTVSNISPNIMYAPFAGFIGTETFEYTVQSGSGTTFTVTVTINVQPIVADGDLTGDGIVDIRDVMRGVKIVLGLVVPDAAEVQRGDVAPLIAGEPASDGAITAGDLIVIQRIVLGNLTLQ